jgi:hypothetical protein
MVLKKKKNYLFTRVFYFIRRINADMKKNKIIVQISGKASKT